MNKRASKSKTLSPGFRVVALGGGTGLSTLLRGLKELVIRRTDEHASSERPISDLAAIVTVTDDGGSSGRKTAITHATMKISRSSRKTRASPSCSIRRKTASPASALVVAVFRPVLFFLLRFLWPPSSLC